MYEDGAKPRGACAKRILIVEDNHLNMRLLADLLAAKGFEVLKAEDGAEAIRLAREGNPDLILMDIQLPGMSGLDATRYLRADARTAGIPIVAVTAFAMMGDEQRILDGGCDAYVAKPIMVPSFVKTVEAFL